MWIRKQITAEEEEDRARSLITRRRFLFLGAAAAGAAILKPPALWTPEIGANVSYNVTFAVGPPPVIGQWADYPTIPKEVFVYQRILNGITNEYLNAMARGDHATTREAHPQLLEITQLRDRLNHISEAAFMSDGK